MSFLFGDITFNDLPHAWYTIGGTGTIIAMLAVPGIIITRLKRWKWLWSWFTSTDPKKIGIMYLIVSAVMFFRGGLDSIMIWLQQALSSGNSHGYLTADHFQQIFTAHGDIMVFFVTMGFFFGLMNLIVPLQIGARDLAFPFLNNLGFWLFAAGAALINAFFAIGGNFAAAGWLTSMPLGELSYSPGRGIDYWIWSLQISGLGSLLSGINFLVTIIKMRAPGMTLWRMPLFTWSSLCSMVLIISAFPVLTAAITLLWLDRFFGMHFFTSLAGGNPMLYVSLIWMWGHPEVYILVLPAFGIWSEIVSTFSGNRIFSYATAVWATILVTVISFLVWLHHFFTMGAGADVNAVFGISTMFIAVPMGVQIFNWILTLWRGRIRFTTPMYWFFGFVSTFMFGGIAGLLLATPAADYQLHNTLFLVAHFHTMIIGGALFGLFAGVAYWFPKISGFKLNERIGKRAFWLWLVGFFVSFTPLYTLGFMGAPRRLDHYEASAGYQPLFIAAAVGVCIITLGALTQVWQIIVSVKERKKNRDKTGDPWNGRTLEWSTPSPAPFYGFPATPAVRGRDAWWHMKQSGLKQTPPYETIDMARNTGMGIYLAALVFLLGFALVWHIIWLAAVGLIGTIACVIIRSCNANTEYELSAERIKTLELARKR